jgi:hypothetical protein
MPTVEAFDSPALIATLAGNAGAFATNQVEQRNAMQLVQQVQQQRAQQEQQALQAQQIQNAQNGDPTYAARLNAWQSDPTHNGGTEYLPTGGQNGSPGGFVPAGTPYGGGGGGRGGYNNAYAHLPQSHQAIIGTIQQMQQAGQLTPEEAARWTGIAAAGGNPLENKTEAEVIREKKAGQSDGLNDYQRSSLGMRVQGASTRMDDQLYERKRNGLKDQLESLNKRLQNATSSDDRSAISGKIADLEGKLAGLADDAENHTPAGATPAPSGGMSDTASRAVMSYVADLLGGKKPGAADKGTGGAAAPSIRQLKPLDPDTIDSYIAKAGGDPALAKRLARQDGYAVP